MFKDQFNALLKRHRWSELFPPVACYEDRIIMLEDTTKNAYLGAVLYGFPLFGADETTMNRLKSVLSTNFPEGTFIQFGLLAHSDVLDSIQDYEDRKRQAIVVSESLTPRQKQMLWANTTSRAEFFRKGTIGMMMEKDSKRLTKQILIVSIKVKCKTSPDEKDFVEAEEIFSKFHDGLNSVGMSLVRGDKKDYLALVRAVIQPHKPMDFGSNETDFLRDQILEPGFSMVKTSKKHLELGGTPVKILSVKRLPDYAHLALMNFMMGDPGGINNQMPGNYYATCMLHYPDQQSEARSIRNRHTLLVQQASGPLGKLIPRLKIKQDGFDPMIDEMDRGGMIVQMQLNLTIYGKTKEEVDKTAAVMSTYLSSYRLEMIEDSLILEALFTNNLPLFPSVESTIMMRRMRTQTVNVALNFCPVVGEWAGSGRTNAMLFNTRRGQVYGWDLYNSDTNYNAIVFAESGAGKSYLINQMVSDYLAEGARVWVIDIGRSYQKLCKILDGEFIEFSDNAQICLNPFTNVEDISDELSMFEELVSKMAAPEHGLDDYRRVRVNEAIKSVFSSLGNDMSISNVAEYCHASDDPRVRDLGAQLHNFTESGMYGHWFEGRNNLQFNSNFVVLELEELSGRPLLQKIVLMLLMAKIEKSMYQNRDGTKKVVIFDESWALFSDPGVARFMIHGYRRARKYDGAMVLVLQNILDFYRTPGMEAIAENSAHKIVLRQQSESVEAIVNEKRISLDDYGKNMMKSIHTVPGWYSEIMFMGSRGYSVGLLKTPSYSRAIYETKGRASHELMARMDAGEDVEALVAEYARGFDNER